MKNYRLLNHKAKMKKYVSAFQNNQTQLLIQEEGFEVLKYIYPNGTTGVFREVAFGTTEVYLIQEGEIILHNPDGSDVLGIGEAFVIEGGHEGFLFEVKEEVHFICCINTNQFDKDAKDIKVLGNLLQDLQKQDGDTLQHCLRVQQLTMEASCYLKEECEVTALFIASRYHDIGKISIPLEVLIKAGPLNDEEYEIMKKHSQCSFDILKDYYNEDICQIVLQHHERYDGLGYPHGLKGDEISIEARLIAVCDAYDAMVTERPYNKGKSHLEAINELIKNKGTQFDPLCVEAFLSCFENRL